MSHSAEDHACDLGRTGNCITEYRSEVWEEVLAACIAAVEATKTNEYDSGRGLSDSDLILFDRIFNALKEVQP